MTPAPVAAWPFLKGHGAQNDFLLLPDPHGRLRLLPEDVRQLCDRRVGIGADGLLRAVHTATDPEAATMAERATWFMDYRNPDGSPAQMCGNGIRVLARYLVDAGHQDPGTLAIATRAGIRHVHVPSRSPEFTGPVTVLMGRPALPGPAGIRVTVADRSWPATHVDMGNPHAVAFVDDLDDAGDLRTPPTVTPADAYPAGVTVEFVAVRGPQHLAVRVHERGVGETRACGTGACAAVAGALARTGLRPAGPLRFAVDLPGGRLTITANPDGTMELIGPAAIVAQGTLNPTIRIPGPRIGWSPARAR
ncbi:diaminopimelate epimerase [Streptomyces sp. WZ-12]|uniref:diaminopimelate epimerase n=1 Tax=Streptomyces sp. WZ-12 TaxID=3030210 RepID=UPI0023812E98|nr:diaminopimelate epimerase [Streptomyces sp. WZ-12]